MTKQAPAREAVIGAHGKVHAHRLVDKNALFASLLRHQRQTAQYRVCRIARFPGLMVQLAARDAAFAGAKQRLAEFRFPRPRQPGNAEDFTFAQVQGDIFQQRIVVQPFHPQQRLLTVRRARGRIDIAQLVAEHLLNNRFAAQIRHRAGLNQPAVAQHRQGVADGLQLLNAVRDKHHADTLLLQTSYYRKQTLTLVRVQRRGGLIKNEKTAVVRERPRQQNLLFFSQRATVDGAAYVERNIQLRQRLPRLLTNRAPAVAVPRMRQLVEHDVFGNA